MAIKPILIYPDSKLKRHCVKVKHHDITGLSRDLIDTMTHNRGAGLAAPQIGVLLRVIAVGDGNKVRILVNPEIISASKDTNIDDEMCLSIPNLVMNLERHNKIVVKAKENGKFVLINAEGLFARVLQHEIDHLDGVLIINKSYANLREVH